MFGPRAAANFCPVHTAFHKETRDVFLAVCVADVLGDVGVANCELKQLQNHPLKRAVTPCPSTKPALFNLSCHVHAGLLTLAAASPPTQSTITAPKARAFSAV